ncbi:amidohydrolase family protein [Kribbella albertanoniae]|uniref:Amidohydrolase n=1 Tax=Kribbella albertanoniae TaxID=1266829 RepID=A0A4R4PW59_9ACTN|nr:amidohydrolase family protein [Kribbella albertanoniae]TDC26698.1 amidohydrolase [Kribbella albertanoniae]
MLDDDVPAWWRGLGLDGLIDVHVHFLPDQVMNAVWAYFDQASTHYGTAWPITYRTSVEERLKTLALLGVRAFPALVYPHKPEMAAWLNTWARDFADRTPGCVPSGTFYPEPTASAYVREALDLGTRIFKVHLQVGDYDPRDEVLDDVWGQLAEAGTPVVAHCGSGPIPGRHTGPGPIGEVLRRHPRLTVVVAHLGMPEYAEHLELTSYPNVHLDTTMALTPFTEAMMPFPRDLVPRLADLADRIVLGSDFPNIPYSYATQLQVLADLELGDGWLRAVCHDNGARLLGV